MVSVNSGHTSQECCRDMSKALNHPLGDSCEEVRLRIEGKASSGTDCLFFSPPAM